MEDGAGKYNDMQAFQHLCNLKESFLEVVGVGNKEEVTALHVVKEADV